jgi:tape measure domain-containing protein
VLGIASPSKKFKEIGKNVGEGFQQGALSSLDKAFDALEGKMRQRGRVLDTVARGIFKMLGMDPAAMLQQARQQRLPAAINWQATAPRQAAAIGPSSRGRLLSAAPSRTAIAGAPSPLGLLPSVTQRSTLKRDLEAFMKAASGSPSVAQGPGKLALSNEALGKRVSAILQEYFKIAEVQVKESFDPRELKRSLNVFSHIAQSLRDAEARTRQARVAQSVDSLMNAIDRSIKAAEASVRVRLARVRELPQGTAQAMLPGARVAGFLPPAMGRAPSPYSSGPALGESRQEMFARRTSEAFRRSAERGASVMQGGTALPPGRPPQPFGGDQPFMRAPSMPSGPAAATRLPAGYHDVNKLVKGLREADQYLQRSRVPLTGAIADLGNQFGYAIKQVLLFGTAYKALAFFMDLPRQAFDATKSLQLFENQINILTGSAAEADRAFSFIDDIVGRLNIPLQSAREGFAQLYASMSPAGIPMGDVENLFEGMSAAAATLGMSSAEMDRMTLAFSQMASKGKIMTEEVTRQLGDVLPGALGKMAQAAQMEIPAFIDAMQKGQLSGEAMTAVLFNMGVILKKEFGEGASQGAKLLRGAMVEIQNSVQRMYESFRPVVEDLAAQAIPALSRIVLEATKGIQAFTASFSSADKPLGELSGTALTVFNTLNSLQEIFKAIGNVAAGIAPAFSLLGQSLLLVIEQLARFINTPVGSFLTNLGLRIAIVTAALQFMTKAGLISAISTIIRLITNLQLLTRWMGVSATAARTLRLALTGLVTGGVLLGIELLVDQLGKAARRMDELRAKTISTTDAIRAMSMTEAIAEQRSIQSDLRIVQGVVQRHRSQTEAARAQFPGAKVRPSATIEITPTEQAALERRGLGRQGLRGGIAQVGQVTGLEMSLQGLEAEARHRQTVIKHEEQTQRQQLRDVVLEPGGDAGAGKEPSFGSYDASQLDFIKQRAEISKQLLVQQKEENLLSETQFKIAVAELDLETAKLLANEQLRLSRLSVTRENLTEQDKATKLKDEESKHANALVIAQEQYLITTRAIRKELAGSLVQATEENIDQIKEQTMLQRNILQGREQLTLDEQAALEVGKALKELKQDEIDLLPEEIALLEKSTVARLKAVQVSERALELLRLRNQTELAGILDPKVQLRRSLEQQGLEGEDLEKRFKLELELQKIEKTAQRIKDIASSIGEAFGSAFKNIVMGASSAREALAGVFNNIAEAFADMVARMLADWIKMQILQQTPSLFNRVSGLTSAAAPAATTATGGLNAVTSTVAPAIAPAITPAIAPAIGPQELQGLPFSQQIIPGRYANGGIVTGPTLGLVGEGRFNEAIVPLPDGRSIPVDLGGGAGNVQSSIVINIDSNGNTQSDGAGANASAFGRKIEGAVKQVIVNELRPGGVLAGSRR